MALVALLTLVLGGLLLYWIIRYAVAAGVRDAAHPAADADLGPASVRTWRVAGTAGDGPESRKVTVDVRAGTRREAEDLARQKGLSWVTSAYIHDA